MDRREHAPDYAPSDGTDPHFPTNRARPAGPRTPGPRPCRPLGRGMESTIHPYPTCLSRNRFDAGRDRVGSPTDGKLRPRIHHTGTLLRYDESGPPHRARDKERHSHGNSKDHAHLPLTLRRHTVPRSESTPCQRTGARRPRLPRRRRAASVAPPTEEEIRVRAYFLSLERRHPAADPRADWLRAEQELAAARGVTSGLAAGQS